MAKTSEHLSTVPPLTIPPGRIRSPAVAGSWYPGDPNQLAKTVDSFLADVESVDGEPIALIVPHAGYDFSGPVAACGFKQLAGIAYDVAVIIAADHHPPLSRPISVWAEGGFETPLGVVPVDIELAEALIDIDPRITFDPKAHIGEHPIEIELPFLQRVCPNCRIVPVLMGVDDEETVEVLTKALLATLPGRRAVVIASSDLSHYPEQKDALRVDKTLLAAIETGDPTTVEATIVAIEEAQVPNLVTSACGKGPILVAMGTAQGLEANTTTVLRYTNSADSLRGNSEHVVGYGAVMFWRYDPPDLTATRRDELLALARAAIAEYLQTGHIPTYETDDPLLTRRAGAFVTLRKRDQPSTTPELSLRGCIGHLWADCPLYQTVQKMAVAAATSDPRFPPMTIEELNALHIGISVLSPLRRVIDIQEIEIGVHGLIINGAGRQGLLLPEVPLTRDWDRQTFLKSVCHKAGLPPDVWPGKASLYAFTTVTFEEA